MGLGRYYFNSGTWARLIRINPEVRADPALVPDALSHVWGVHEDAHHSLIRALWSGVRFEK